MPTYRWKGQLIKAPSLEAVQMYIASINKSTEEDSEMWKPPADVAERMDPYKDAIAAAEKKYGIPSSMLARQLYQESRFRPDIISGETRSPAGAIGIAQFMPATAKQYGVDPKNPEQSIDGAARYMRDIKKNSASWEDALAKYNWGMGNFARKGGMAGAPKETRDYVKDIIADVGDAGDG